MAKILYGVAGEGFGHSSRAKEIINYLQEKGHIVKVISHDKGYESLIPYFDVEKIFGLRFAYKNNKVQVLPTLFKNLLKSVEAVKSIDKVSKIIDKFKAQIVFSDFEPISNIVANIKKTPLISIDNQHRLINVRIEYPIKYKQDALTAKAVVELMIFNAKAYLVTTFVMSKAIGKKNFSLSVYFKKRSVGNESKTKKLYFGLFDFSISRIG